VREHAQVAVPEIAKLLKVEDVTRFVIPMVERLASGYAAEEEQRVTAAELINALSAVIPREVTLQHLVPLLITLSTDNMFRVRKVISFISPWCLLFCLLLLMEIARLSRRASRDLLKMSVPS